MGNSPTVGGNIPSPTLPSNGKTWQVTSQNHKVISPPIQNQHHRQWSKHEFISDPYKKNLNSSRNIANDKSKMNIGKNAEMHEIVDFRAHIAIDFGTDGCALAFAFNGKVTVYNQWKSTKRQNVQKAKTQILSDDKNNCIAFGDTAKKMYSNLIGSEKHKWKYIEKFKMSLLTQQTSNNTRSSVNISSQLIATNGSTCPAEKVFIKAFQDLREKALEYLEKLAMDCSTSSLICPCPTEKEIQWIITVPAIWNDCAKQKMREWAIKANLINPNIRNQCRIVYEPDCAALAIRELYHKPDEDTYYDQDNIQHINAMDITDYTKITGVSSLFNLLAVVDIDQQSMSPSIQSDAESQSEYDDDKTAESHQQSQSLNTVGYFMNIGQNILDSLQKQNVDPMVCSSSKSKSSSKSLKMMRSKSFAAIEEDGEDQEGDKYILIDAGGGTVDIVVHEILQCKSVKEVFHPSGGAWGSTYIDDTFEILLNNLFSPEWIMEFKQESPNYYIEIMDNFQFAKTEFYHDINTKTHCVELPFEFVQFLHSKCKQENRFKDLNQKIMEFSNGKSLKQMFAKNEYEFNLDQFQENENYFMCLKDECIEMDVEIWKFMFDGVIDKIINHVNDLLNDKTVDLRKECKWIYLVGGFSCSKYFQYRMKKQFEDDSKTLQVIIPKCPTLAIVTGAALFGITDNYITARKSKYFYGIRVMRNIKQAKHYKMSDDNISNNSLSNGKIKNCFHIMIKKNQLIRMNDFIEITVKCKERISDLVILRSEEKPEIESDGESLGNFNIEYDDSKQAVIQFHFSDTTFAVYTYSKSNPYKKRILKEIDY